jgi:hypothetical protein
LAPRGPPSTVRHRGLREGAKHAEWIAWAERNGTRDGLAIQIALDRAKAACEQILAFQFLYDGAESCVFGLTSREEFLVTILKVLREFVGNFRFARGGEFQRSNATENFRLPVRHFLPP